MWRNPRSKSKEYCSLPTIFNVIVTTILQTYVCILVRKLLWKNKLPGAELLYQTAAANLCCCWYFYSRHYWHNLYLIEDGHVTLFYSVHHVGVIFFISPGHEGSKMCRHGIYQNQQQYEHKGAAAAAQQRQVLYW